MTICILGRQPELGLAELEALYGATSVQPLGAHCALVDAEIDFARLGGSVKAAQLLDEVPGTNLRAALKRLPKLIPNIIRDMPEGKIKLGLSTYGFDLSAFRLNGEALRIKKIIQAAGRSVRVVPGETTALSSAQTYHNHLAGDLGIELLIVQGDNKISIGQITHVQHIDSYRIRDRERPKRDPFVGMLPPKLAQIIVNLAVGKIDLRPKTSDLSKEPSQTTQIYVLDPFCGTGVILQEALLMGYSVYGTDLSPKMIDYTKANLEWLRTANGRQSSADRTTTVEVADATSYTWPFLRSDDLSISRSFCVASETYLGQPLGGQHPTKEKMSEIVHDTNTIVSNFLKNISKQIPSGTRLCLAVPAWFIESSPTRLPVVEELDSFGFTCHTFSYGITPMIYHRESQVTGRELLVLIKE